MNTIHIGRDPTTGSWRHPTVYMTPPQRIGRIVLGMLGAIAGVLLIAPATTVVAIVLASLRRPR